MSKNIYVEVAPPCVSANRELQYVMMVELAYNRGQLAPNMTIIEETESHVTIRYNR